MSTTTERGIRAIETLYRGCRFRSRFEARWAVFFQTLGIPWQYEPEGFVLSTGAWYLSEFLVRLKGRSLWIEVKPTGVPAPLFEQFMEDSKQSGTILREVPDPGSIHEGSAKYEFFFDGHCDCSYQFCICNSCGATGFEYSGRAERIRCDCRTRSADSYDHPLILRALTAARFARFEAGA